MAVVLVGSSVHGGAVVRRVMETENDSQADIDWAVLYDKQPGSRPPFLDISIVGGGIIEKIIRKTLIPGNLSPCSQTDPEFCHAENLANTPQALELVEQARTLFDYQSLLLYLLPSYPPEANQQNRKYFLEALSSLAKENPDLWKEQVDKLFKDKEWEFQHLIKFKHLISLSSPERDTSLAHQVETLSEKVMPLAIKTLLYFDLPKTVQHAVRMKATKKQTFLELVPEYRVSLLRGSLFYKDINLLDIYKKLPFDTTTTTSA